MSQPSDPVEWACTRPWSAWFLYSLMFWVIMTMVSFLLASFCVRGQVPKYDAFSVANPEATFMHGHFGCLADMNICLMSFLCPVVRWSDSMHMAGLLSFWLAFGTLAACYLPATIFIGVFGIFLVVPLVYYRQKLRDKLGLPSGNETYVTDCCFACWCSCCLIAQEARVINEAYMIGHTSMPMSGGQADA